MTISAVASSVVDSAAAANSMASLSSNQETFLKLLTAQLQNQDPLAPTDTNTFTQQLVQYSQVEQQIQTNSKLDTIAKLNVSSKIQNALSMVGGDVQYGGSTIDFTQGGTGTINYNLAANSASTTINIVDESGNVVYTAEGALTKGDSTFTWDGTTTQGTAAPTGEYKVVIAAKDSAGNAITTKTSVWGQVTSVQATDKEILLMLQGGGSVSLDDVANVRAHDYSTSS